jgi:PAS domain S-box-containing protein
VPHKDSADSTASPHYSFRANRHPGRNADTPIRMAQPQILVVEDNPVIAGMIRRFLTKSNYGITGVVTTGEEAVELAGQSMPSLALMDVQLAGKMDGITAARLIGEKFQIPTIYLTGSSDAETIARAASTEAYGYLLKPVQERELIKTVEVALSKHESECRAREHESWLAATFQCIADAVIGTDSAGLVKLLNPAAEVLTGWKQAEAAGQELADVFKILNKDTRQPAECAVAEVIRNKIAYRSDVSRIAVARDGTETIGKETAAPILNRGGRMVGVVFVFRS